MSRRNQCNQIEGGKIKSSKQINRSIRKGFKKTIEDPINKNIINPIDKAVIKPTEHQVLPALAQMGIMAGDLTNDYLLPTVKTIGIPMASTVAGLAGNYFGGPVAGELSSKLSNSLMKEYIPGQSKNKYVNMLGDALGNALGATLTGSADPTAMMDMGQKFLGSASNDILGAPKQSTKTPYDPNNPYMDILNQLLSNVNDPHYYDDDDDDFNDVIRFKSYRNDNKINDSKLSDYNISTPEELQFKNQQDTYSTLPITDTTALNDNDALYRDDELGPDADTITQKYPPYQQLEGSSKGLLGSGIKKKKGRPKKEVQLVEVVEKLPYQRYSHSNNKALNQYLYNTNLKKNKERQKQMDELTNKQIKYLNSMGF